MASGWSNLIFLLFACRYALGYTLSPELTAFVPECAQDCFKSFIASNFGSFPDPLLCGSTPTLSCLCSTNTTSGYTIGEGAVQCIISEDDIGFCQGSNATTSVVVNAYTMCNGIQDAIPETHGTITATLVVQTSMPSIVLVPPPATTISNTSSTMSTSTPSMTTLPTASAVRPTSISSTATALAASSTPSATTAPLSGPLIAGIAVAATAGVAIFVGLILCLICWRRRKQARARRDSDSMPFQNEPPAHLMEQKSVYSPRPRGWKPVIAGPGPTANGVATKMSPDMSRSPPPVPARMDNSDPMMFSRRSIKPDAIGLAISPNDKGFMAADRRRASRLLPEKPTLRLTVPPSQEKQANGLSFSQPRTQPLGLGRESTATQFEEDIDTAATAVNSDDAWITTSSDETSKSQTRVEYGSRFERVLEEPPRRQVSEKRRSGLHVAPLSVARMQVSNNSTQPQGRSLLPSLMPAPQPSPGGSSSYSGRRSDISNGIGRSNTMSSQHSYRQAGPYDNEPIEFVASPEDYDEPQRTGGPRTGGTTDLSPVMESPASGKSPVSYPKIPEAISPKIMRMNYGPPPAQPNFTRGLGSPLSQSREPWRAAEIQAQKNRARIARQMAEEQAQAQSRGSPRATPSRAATSNGHARKRSSDKDIINELPATPRPARKADQSQIPPSLRINTRDNALVTPPPRSRTAPLTDATGGWNYNPYISHYAQSQPQSRSEPQNQNQQGQRPQPQPFQTQNRRRDVASPKTFSTATSSSNTIPSSQNPLMSPVWTPQAQPQPLPQNSSHPQSQQRNENQLQAPSYTQALKRVPSSSALSTNSQHSTSSSLLAKRLGESKASKLALRTDDMVKEGRRQQAKWRVLDREGQDRAREGGWRPMLSAGLDGNFPRDVDEGIKREDGGRIQFAERKEGIGREFERMDLPSTPGWVPKLTPTRRGDVLFLNVQ